jgi:hypothetical protein
MYNIYKKNSSQMLWPDFISCLLEEPFQIFVTYLRKNSLTYDIFELLVKI